MNPSLRWWHVLISIVAITLCTIGALLACSTFGNNVSEWLSPSSEQRAAHEKFERCFGGYEYAIVSWEGCSIDDPTVERIEEELREKSEHFHSVISGRSVLEQIRGQDDELADSLSRLENLLLGADRETTGLFFRFSEAGEANRPQAFELIRNTVAGHGIDPDQIKIGGSAANMWMLDSEGFWSPLRVIPCIVLCSFLLGWLFLGDARAAFFVMSLGAFAGGLSLNFVYLSGEPLNAIVWTLPTLVLLITVSGCLHFLGYYRDARQRCDAESLVRETLKRATRPTMLCAATTSVGLLSLGLSETSAVRQFGFFGSLSVMASCLVVLTILPVYLRLFPIHASARLSGGRLFSLLAVGTKRFRIPIITLCALVMLLTASALPRLRTSANILRTFPESSKLAEDSQWIENNLVSLSSAEVLVEFSNAKSENDVERIRFLDQVATRLKKLEQVNAVASAATYCPVMPKRKTGFRNRMRSRMADDRLAALKPNLIDAAFVSVDGNTEVWRASTRLSRSTDIQRDNVVPQIEAIFSQEVRQRWREIHDEGLDVSVSGQACMLTAVEQQFATDLQVTYLTAFALISLIVLVMLRSFELCLIATLPNIFPAVIVLGTVSLLAEPLDVASLMTASVALGIAVDDTLHFMLWRHERLRAGASKQEAIEDATRHCGLAMMQTSVVCGISLAIYGLAGFLPTIRFGLLLSCMLFAALIGDLLLLPALLYCRAQTSDASEVSKEEAVTG